MLRKYRLLLWFFGIVAAGALSHGVIICIDGLTDEVGKADVIIVFGSKVFKDKSPSDRLRARLDRALELYRANYATKILVSGGIDPEGTDEAAAMANYLYQREVASEDVLLDRKGYTTYATAQSAALIFKKLGYRRALLVTQYFHISRARLAFRKKGVEIVYTAHARYFELRDFYSIAREVVGYYYYLLR